MTEKMSDTDKERLARNLRRLLPKSPPESDVTLSNSEAAEFVGGISVRTLKRISFPNCEDGPVPIRYKENGNLYWSMKELAAYKTRKQIQLETILMDSSQGRDALTDLLEL